MARDDDPQLLTLVLADHSGPFRRGVARALRSRSIDVVAAPRDGAAALEATRTYRPDLLVVEDRMPGLTGPEVAAEVTSDPALADVRVLILAAKKKRELVERASHAGAFGVVDRARSRAQVCDAIVALASFAAP